MTAWLLTLMPWRAATATIRVCGLAAAVAILAVRGLPGRVANMFALTLIFAGGAASKLASGWLAAARGT
jgi:hypothetical protein